MSVNNVSFFGYVRNSDSKLFNSGKATSEEILLYNSFSNDDGNTDTFTRSKNLEFRQSITQSWEGMSIEEDSSSDDESSSTSNFFMELLED